MAEAATTLAAISLDPLIEKGEEAGRRRLLELAAIAIRVALALDSPRRVVGAGASLALDLTLPHGVFPSYSGGRIRTCAFGYEPEPEVLLDYVGHGSQVER